MGSESPTHHLGNNKSSSTISFQYEFPSGEDLSPVSQLGQFSKIVSHYFPHLKGSLIHMFLIPLHLTRHNATLRKFSKSQENSRLSFIFLFRLLSSHLPRCVDLGFSFGHKSPSTPKAAAELRSQPRIFQWVCNLANTGSFIPIKWKSKHIFCRNPTPIDPSCLLPLPCYSQQTAMK